MGLVFKPTYIPTVSFSQLLMTINDWTNNPQERLKSSCLTFLSVSNKSRVFPLCKEYPVLLDFSAKRLMSSSFTWGPFSDFRAFKLPLLKAADEEVDDYIHYISVPCYMGLPSWLVPPHKEGETPAEGFWGSSLQLPMTAPTGDHWSLHEYKKFNQVLQCLTSDHKTKEEKEAEEGVKMREEERKEAEKAASQSSHISAPSHEMINDIETLDEGEHQPPTRSRKKLLEQMAIDAGISLDDDLNLPSVSAGKPSLSDEKFKAELCKKAEKVLNIIHSFHLQAIYDAGGVRQVDRILAELLMAEFTHVNLMFGEDLNTSLGKLFPIVEDSGKTLLEDLKAAVGPTVSNLIPYSLQKAVDAHNTHLYTSLTKVLVFLDCVRCNGQDFLEDRVKGLQSNEEFKKLISALSERISNYDGK